MIYFLKGILTSKFPTWIEINVNGVGYGINVPLSTFEKLPPEKNEALVYTYLHVREDFLALYGFISPGDRDMFLLLLSISGVGPKVALAVLSSLNENQVRSAVLGGKIDLLCSIPEIGKKTAERIILELKDKLTKKSLKKSKSVTENEPASANDSLFDDSMMALVSLGYSMNDASKAVELALSESENKPLTIEEIIKIGLSKLIHK